VLEEILKIIGDGREGLKRLLGALSPQQKRFIVLGAPVFLIAALTGNYFYKRASYSPLFTNLSLQDGAAVMRELEADKIPFQIGAEGSSISVPRQVVYQTRLKLAGKGIPIGGGVGFEIFEKSSFGMSEFTQQVNYLRALQGELARTINALSAVQSSRVHLALPSRSSFLGAEEKPSASAVLELRPGHQLTTDQVDGIIHLIATSVPKLTPEHVTVLDTSGRLLRSVSAPGISMESEALHQLKVQYEQETERRIETMLDPVLGPGRVVARVNAQMSFQETQLVREQFDPNNQVVRVQQQLDDTSTKTATATKGGIPGVQSNVPGGDGVKEKEKEKENNAKRGGQMVSYEVGKTTSRIVEPRGQITRTSVAVLVDGKYENGAYVPRSAEELAKIKGIVMRAIGYDEARGDQVEVANIPFKGEPPSAVSASPLPMLPPHLDSWLTLGATAGAALLVFLFLFRALGRKQRRLAGEAAGQTQLAREMAAVAAEKIVVAPDPRREQLVQIARDYHDATVRIIRMWLQEENGQKNFPATGSGKHAELN
jgi:flagellar M-ring protein FliF